METPSSTRRVTRSQTVTALANSANSTANISRKVEESDKGVSKSRQRTGKQEQRSALIDITNDSPIVGVANGSLETPVSSVAKQSSRRNCKRTPGSGEALLRGQVKTLLQKVEEEAEISKFSLDSRHRRPLLDNLKAFLNSPAGILAPTPANTPQVLNFSDIDEFESLGSVSQSPIQDQLTISQVVSGIFDGMKEAESVSETEKDLISRALFLDFSEKSDSSSECSSVVTYQGTGGVEVEKGSQENSTISMEDDDASIWSIQVNASTRGEDEDEEAEVIEDDIEAHVVVDDDDEHVYDDDDEEYGEEEVSESLVDELCEEMSKISVNDGKKFMGKHKRFVYNSDDELVEVYEEESVVAAAVESEDDSAEVLRLKGLPTPKGKHVLFQEEGDEE